MLAVIIAVKAGGAVCLALRDRVTVGGKSKSGATTITSVTAIKNRPTSLAQRFTATTLNNSMLPPISFVKYRDPGQRRSATGYLSDLICAQCDTVDAERCHRFTRVTAVLDQSRQQYGHCRSSVVLRSRPDAVFANEAEAGPQRPHLPQNSEGRRLHSVCIFLPFLL
jgi:hypothetical protein